MAIQISCSCGKILEADERDRGAQAKCPACGSVMVIDDRPVNSKATQTSTSANPIATSIASGEPPFVPLPQVRESRKPMFGPVGYLLIGCIVVAMFLVCLIGYNITGTVGDDSDTAIAATQAKGPLTTACMIYLERNGKQPDNLKDLLVKNDNGGPYLEGQDSLTDPWGQPFQYDAKGPRNGGTRPDIWTVEPRSGTIIGNWPKGR